MAAHFLCLIAAALLCVPPLSRLDAWGFEPHRILNRMAVLTLPTECMPMFKAHIDYLSFHATDADKRRYATNYEAPRHYIDLDELSLPDTLTAAPDFLTSLKSTRAVLCIVSGDTTSIAFDRPEVLEVLDSIHFAHRYERYIDLTAAVESLPAGKEMGCHKVLIDNILIGHGILPFNLVDAQRRLTRAIAAKDIDDILRRAADLGHYIADAHVPLHTTSNYNGQKTGQTGLHAFWETRIPELEVESYDFLVGKARYIDDKHQFFWSVVLDSHSLVDSVLDVERVVRSRLKPDHHYCDYLRNDIMTRLECPEFARAYSRALRGMVEDRMQAAILAIGSAWYTAWVDAGRPMDLLHIPGDSVITGKVRSDVGGAVDREHTSRH